MSGRTRVAIDLVPIHAGRGGAGGGIWSHASSLARHLDALDPHGLEIVLLARPGQQLPDGLRNVRVERVDAAADGAASRLRWVHAELPALCRRLGARVLHKLATEVPARVPAGTRLVATVHDFMPQHYRERLRDEGAASGTRLGHPLHDAYFAFMARRALDASHTVITVSDAVAAEARRRFPRARARIVTVHNGVDAAPAETPAADAPGDGMVRVLCVGAFRPHKGQLAAVRLMDLLAEHHPEAARRAPRAFRGFADDLAYHAAVRAAAERSPARERIRFLPYEHAARPADIYAGADLLLLLSTYEGFGLPPLEAQAAGVPVLCTDIPAFREVLGEGARFVAPDDPARAADALARLVVDPAERAALALRGRANVPRFSWARAARETAEVYRGAAGTAPAAPGG